MHAELLCHIPYHKRKSHSFQQQLNQSHNYMHGCHMLPNQPSTCALQFFLLPHLFLHPTHQLNTCSTTFLLNSSLINAASITSTPSHMPLHSITAHFLYQPAQIAVYSHCNTGSLEITPKIPTSYSAVPRPAMEKKLQPIATLTASSRKWSCRVLLIDKTHIRRTRTTGNTFQRYIFSDAEGTRIQGISYAQDTAVLDRMLQLMRTYIISNARITRCAAEYRVVEHELQLILTAGTAMQLAAQDPLPRSLGLPGFTPFSRLSDYKGTTNNIDVLAIALDKSPQREITSQHGTATVQDIALITSEKIPMILSLWNDFIQDEGTSIVPIIQPAMSFTIIAAFRGLSLSAKGFSNILVDPPFPEAAALRSWATTNFSYLQSLVNSRAYFATARDFSSTSDANLSAVAALLTHETEGRFTIIGNISLSKETQSFYYTACPDCHRGTTASPDQEFTCLYCNKDTFAVPRLKYSICITDASGQVDVTTFGNIAEQLIGVTASEISTESAMVSAKAVNTKAINLELKESKYRIEVRKKEAAGHRDIPFFYTLLDFAPLPTDSGTNPDCSDPTNTTAGSSSVQPM